MSSIDKVERKYWGKLIDREQKIYNAVQKRIEKKDRNAVERFLHSWAKDDKKDLRRWEKRYSRD